MKSWNELPKEIQDKVLERQLQEDGENDMDVLKLSCTNWFTWVRSVEGAKFWVDVLVDDKHDIFFQRYPKKTFPREMWVWDKEGRTKEKKMVLFDAGEDFEWRYLAEAGRSCSGKKDFTGYRFAEEAEPEPVELVGILELAPLFTLPSKFQINGITYIKQEQTVIAKSK